MENLENWKKCPYFCFVNCSCPEDTCIKKQQVDAFINNPALNTKVEINENTSDGHHTFKELYEFRKAYNVALFNEWAKIKTGKIVDWGSEPATMKWLPKYDVHKSWKHNNGELCFGGGWFIVVAVLPDGQISNHYKAEDWDLFKIPEEEKAKYEFDGHTGQDVINRLLKIK